MLTQKLRDLLNENSISVTETQLTLLIKYLELLVKWNRTYNLTAVRDPEEMLTKHLVDSLVICPYLKGNDFIDVGTGAGLPGIPLAIVNPEKQFTLVDSLGKRIRFLNHVKLTLGLSNIEPIQIRVEQLKHRQFDGVISRAFASLETMVTLTQHLARATGRFYALKGLYPKEELTTLPIGFFLESVIPFHIPSMKAERHLIILRK